MKRKFAFLMSLLLLTAILTGNIVFANNSNKAQNISIEKQFENIQLNTSLTDTNNIKQTVECNPS